MSNWASTISSIAEEVSKFPCVTYLDDVQLSDGLLAGSIKNAVVIACSDMGWLVPYVCSSADVQISLFQNFGHRFRTGGVVETIVGSSVGNVIVYGHSVCEYTRFLARSILDRPTDGFLRATETKQQLDLYLAALESEGDTLWEKVGQYNVLKELRALLADPVVAPMADRGGLKLHGWFYKSASQQLAVFDPDQEAFIVQRSKLHGSLVMNFVPDQSCVGED